MGNADSLPAPPHRRTSSSMLAPPEDNRPPRPPFVDPNSGFSYDTNFPDLEGWLSKQSDWLKEWRVRYMILKGAMLFFAKSEFDAPHGMIDLTDCAGVKTSPNSLDFTLEGGPGQQPWQLRANTKREMDIWAPTLAKGIKDSIKATDFNEKYRAMLMTGQMFEKHHHDAVGRFNLSNKDNHRLVRVTRDGQRITWHKAGKTDVYCDSIDLNTVEGIHIGFTTLVFKQTGKKGKEKHCFSIISSDRSLDLEASSPETARLWCAGLRALLKYGNILTPAELKAADEREAAREVAEEKRRQKALGKHEGDRAKLRQARERANHIREAAT